jgi:hypothetical protein
VTNQEGRPGTLKKCRVIARVPELGSKCNGRMRREFHFQKGRAAAQTTPAVTGVSLGRNEIGSYAT